MPASSYSRGHSIAWDGAAWRYKDTGEIHDGKRACNKCQQHPTAEGHDACLGTLPGITNACCGHGVEGLAYQKGAGD